jgi:hypothetical protein
VASIRSAANAVASSGRVAGSRAIAVVLAARRPDGRERVEVVDLRVDDV